MVQVNILIVEDEVGIANFLQQGLQEEGYQVYHSIEAQGAMELIKSKQFHVILLDRMLIGASGLELCKSIRGSNTSNKDTPIIFLTAKDTLEDTLEGLSAGANDYIKKPFAFSELLARIQVQLRTFHGQEFIENGDIRIYPKTYQVYKNKQLIDLTLKEYHLLYYLFVNKNKVCSRKQIIQDIWDIHFDYDSSVIEVFVNGLRKKLHLEKSDPRLCTVRGVGYMSKDV
ncbi:response regulator transcription factor [Myroides sp. LJL119]